MWDALYMTVIDGDDRRLHARSTRCRAPGSVFTIGRRDRSASRPFSTRSRSSWRGWSRATSRRGGPGGAVNACSTSSTSTSSSAASAASGTSSRGSSRGSRVPVRHHRARSRPHARGDRARLPRRRGRREQRERAASASGSTARAASSPPSAPTPRTSTPCSPRACCGRTCSSSAAPRPTTPRRSWCGPGADRVLSPYQIGGLQLAQTALRPAVVDFVQLATSSDNLDLNMEQVQIASARRSPAGRSSRPTCASASASIVVGIQRADGRMEFNPAARRARCTPGDDLVVLGQRGEPARARGRPPARRATSPERQPKP